MSQHQVLERGNSDRKPGSLVNRVRNLQRALNRQARRAAAEDAP